MNKPNIVEGTWGAMYLKALKSGDIADPITFMEQVNNQPIGDGFINGQEAVPQLKAIFKWYLNYKQRTEAYDKRRVLITKERMLRKSVDEFEASTGMHSL